MTKLHVSPEVQKDLQGIKEYIALELENPTAALKIISNITGAIRGLLTFPDKGTPAIFRW